MQTTTLNRPWLFKVGLFFLIFVGFGAWGWYEATVTYPRRGARYADTRLFEYLTSAQKTGPLTSRVSVPDPASEVKRLKEVSRSLEEVESRKLEWLQSLEVVGKLRPEFTTMSQPDTKLPSALGTTYDGYAALQKDLNQRGQPKRLDWYDIPVQWIFTAVGLGGGLWLALLFVNVARVKYQWDESTQTLTLPGGATLTPADLEDVDKRKWDKYIVFLKIKPTHPTLGGREVKVDLYRYTPLEAWVLEMERTAFPERAAEEEAKSEEAAPESAPEQQASA